ncbi:MAG: transposase [Bacteroidales bacterium]|nr:transposase [Bacteroidales bacterium]
MQKQTRRIGRNRVLRIWQNTTTRFYGFKLHWAVNDKGELLNFCIAPANVDDRNRSVIRPLCKRRSGKRPLTKAMIALLPIDYALSSFPFSMKRGRVSLRRNTTIFG